MFDDLPKDFCTLFWNTLIATIFLPITIIGFWIPEWNKKFMVIKILYGVLFWILSLYIMMLGDLILEKLGWINIKEMSMFLLLPLGAVTGIMIITMIFGIGGGCVYLGQNIYDKIQEKRYGIPFSEKKPSKLSIIWNTIRNKYCTKINWK